MYSPIAIFAYNRPEHLRKTVEALAGDPLARHSDLFIFSDNAKTSEHAANVALVRGYVSRITGFQSVNITERVENMGLANSIEAGVSSLCNRFGRVIVLEDDLLVRPGFLEFINTALDRYENEKSVYQVSGYMYPGDYISSDDACFLPLISCWGWGTWKRAWSEFNLDLSGLDDLKTNADLAYRFNINGSYDYLGMARQQKTGKINSWGICWYLNVFMKNGLTLFPRKSFVQNIGVDSSGTHGAGHGKLQEMLDNSISYNQPLKFPAEIVPNIEVLVLLSKLLKPLNQSLLNRIYGWIKK